jgi:uncharacterized protein (TIGR03435 family)
MLRHQVLPALGLLISLVTFAQQEPLASFDAASIKPNHSGARAGGTRTAPGRIVASNATAKMLLQEAYNVTAYQLSGGPGWLDNDRYDVEAKASGAAAGDEMRPMLQRLLAERFKVIVHRETKEMQVILITVAKSGFKLHELQLGDPAPAPAPSKEGAVGTIVRTGPISDLAAILTGPMGMPVLDRTGLQGKYFFDVAWGVDEDMITAVQEELGLKFESQKAPIDLVVIDHIEKPDPN